MDAFPKIDGFETLTSFMQKRCLLEYVMFKHVINQEYHVVLEDIVNEAGISTRDEDLRWLLESVVQNDAISFHHQDLFTNMITSTLDLDCFIDCNPFVVNKMLNKLGYNDTYSFAHAKNEDCKGMIAELNEKISLMKKLLNDS